MFGYSGLSRYEAMLAERDKPKRVTGPAPEQPEPAPPVIEGEPSRSNRRRPGSGLCRGIGGDLLTAPPLQGVAPVGFAFPRLRRCDRTEFPARARPPVRPICRMKSRVNLKFIKQSLAALRMGPSRASNLLSQKLSAWRRWPDFLQPPSQGRAPACRHRGCRPEMPFHCAARHWTNIPTVRE